MPNSTTGRSPAEMMFQRQIRTPFHLLKPGEHENYERSTSRGTRSFKTGDKVWARSFASSGDKWISGEVSKKLGNVTYEISFKGKESSNRHIDHLTERREGEEEEMKVRTTAEGRAQDSVKVTKAQIV